MTEELKPCPFCGWHGIHMRKKTQMRESVTGFMYMRGYDQFDPYSLGFIGQDFREDHCYDYRFGIRFFCGKCKAETPYVWGEWHLPTEDEVETFDDLPHACERFDPDEERETIGKAIAAWNRRAEAIVSPEQAITATLGRELDDAAMAKLHDQMNAAMLKYEMAQGIEKRDEDGAIVVPWVLKMHALLEEAATLGSCNCSNNCTNSERTGTCIADETETISVRGDMLGNYYFDKHFTIHVMECSECGHTYEHVNGGYEFCPHCGRRCVG